VDLKSVLSKTEKGREEVETRKYKLDQRLRAVLITVNGKLTVGELARQFSQTSDILAQLDKLLREGFVQEPQDDTARLKQARAEVAALVVGALGPDGDAIALKVESAKTLEELRAYLESRRAVLDGALGKGKAEAFWARVASLTG
jgi:primosomal protein N'